MVSETAIFSYKVDNFYNKEFDRGIAYDDQALKINWGMKKSHIKASYKDMNQLPLEIIKR